jgi:hypothetical protein
MVVSRTSSADLAKLVHEHTARPLFDRLRSKTLADLCHRPTRVLQRDLRRLDAALQEQRVPA